MYRKKILLIALFVPTFHLCSLELMKDYLDYKEEQMPPTIDDDLIYGEGSSEVTSQLNAYDQILPNKPIEGTLFVTHLAKNSVDVNSFRLGTKPLKAVFVQSSQMSISSNIIVSVYRFQLDGLPLGTHTLPSINVKVAGKEVRALPLVIEVSE